MSFFFDRWFRFLVGALIFLFFLISVQDVYTQGPPPPPADPPYGSSAHGDSTTGVNRTSTTIYSPGQCAHCHEQHASINGDEPTPAGGAAGFCLLANNFSGATTNPYIQSDNACFYCHYGTGTLQTPAFDNYTYSRTFGGYLTDATASIMDAFNLLSYHNLNDVRTFAIANWPTTFTASSNPCSACHNVHIAKRNRAAPGDPTETAISKPSDHGKLWGDDDGIIDILVSSERMNAYTLYYQAPYYYYSVTPVGYEPNNSTTIYDGSNIPDYVTFCTDCHNSTNIIYSNTLLRDLKTIDWVNTGGEAGGDKHGKNVATQDGTGGYVNLDDPYNTVWGSANGLVLSCTDCHEPHGASSVMLIRNEVNGAALTGVITPFENDNWKYLCERCHDCDTSGTGGTLEDIHHDNTGAPYFDPSSCSQCHDGPGRQPIDCNNCHFHGGDDSWLPLALRSGRRTF